MIEEMAAADVYAARYTKIMEQRRIEVLADLERATHLRVLSPQMLSGYLQGQYLALLSDLVQPNLVVEVGTFTGYSAICLAQGLRQSGRLHTIEYDEELASIIGEFVAKADLQEQISLHIGDAKTVIPTLPDEIDLAFIDADKLAYSQYYNLLVPKMRRGGIIVVDNVLWHGKVYDSSAKDAKTQALRDFVREVHEDERVRNLLLPLRDGLMIAKKVL